ncbi:hypothetical protein PDJAM_G00026000 [Pangasius djambal]|uniref:Uncharacterized protein n=1 Tax=Pangasius djambal TaxID=1691987 RepID=A0ACC5YPK6_9TELE|nr:hypothetical protein [Pangasius djambal]
MLRSCCGVMVVFGGNVITITVGGAKGGALRGSQLCDRRNSHCFSFHTGGSHARGNQHATLVNTFYCSSKSWTATRRKETRF